MTVVRGLEEEICNGLRCVGVDNLHPFEFGRQPLHLDGRFQRSAPTFWRQS
jgi:hypothetical protein